MTDIIIKSNVDNIKQALIGGVLRKAASAGGEVVRNYAKLNVRSTFSAKSKGGAGLAGSIIVSVVKSDNTLCTVDIGPTKVYGRIQELGGVITPVYAKMLSWVGDDGVRRFANSVRLPPRPYMRPAMDNHKDDIIKAVGYQIEKGIRDSLEKL